MPGTKAGGAKAAATNRRLYGDNFYKEIGRKGGIAPNVTPKGFAANPELAKIAGKKGGSISKRKPKVVEPVEEPKTSIWDRLRVKKGSA